MKQFYFFNGRGGEHDHPAASGGAPKSHVQKSASALSRCNYLFISGGEVAGENFAIASPTQHINTQKNQEKWTSTICDHYTIRAGPLSLFIKLVPSSDLARVKHCPLILWPVRDFGCDRVVWWRVKHDARHAFPWTGFVLGKTTGIKQVDLLKGNGSFIICSLFNSLPQNV